MKFNSKAAYALRADAVYLLRGVGFKYAELAAILRVSKETVRKLEARGRRKFKPFNRADGKFELPLTTSR